MPMTVTGFKYDNDSGTFECYGNVKNNIDHAQDRTLDGAYVKSIERHKASGTMPKMFWMHNPQDLPVGKWIDMREDAKGLWMKGKLSDTTMGRDIQVLAKDGALDSFSIGYRVVSEQWNSGKSCNDLVELDIVETSWVNLACNEESRLVGIKSKLDEGEVLTKRELEKFLRESGLSRKQANTVCSRYDDSVKNDAELDIFEQIAKI